MKKNSFFTLALFTALIILSAAMLAGCVSTETVGEKSITPPPAPETPAEEESAPSVPMVNYEGDLINIFFHPLVNRPEIAFTGSQKAGFLNWFVTVDEFKKVLTELYTGGYVLIDINEVYDVSYVGGVKKVTGKRLLVPEGKKPMVLSIDDLSYHKYMRDNGIVHKLVIDGNGKIAAWTDNENGGELSYDEDIVTILEDFIEEHPDFSLQGAKGIIALTGYEGVLGYQTQYRSAPGLSNEVEGAAAVVNKLKERGWRFASHSYTHWNLRQRSMEHFMRCTNYWDKEVRPIVGDTDLFIYPFGAGLESQEEKHRVLRDRNFNLFFGVGSGIGYRERGDYIYFSRKNIDGVYFRTFRNRRDALFNVENVIDNRYR